MSEQLPMATVPDTPATELASAPVGVAAAMQVGQLDVVAMHEKVLAIYAPLQAGV